MSWLKRLLNSVFTYSKYRHVNLPDGKMQLYVLSTLFINAFLISEHVHMVVLYGGRPSHIHTGFLGFAFVLFVVFCYLKKCKISSFFV